MLTLVSKDSVKNSDHFDVLCVLIACMVLEVINQNQMSKNQKSSLIVWNNVALILVFLTTFTLTSLPGGYPLLMVKIQSTVLLNIEGVMVV